MSKREDGCTLQMRHYRERHLGVTDDAETAVEKINAGRHLNQMVCFERYSGNTVWIDPNMVVEIS